MCVSSDWRWTRSPCWRCFRTSLRLEMRFRVGQRGHCRSSLGLFPEDGNADLPCRCAEAVVSRCRPDDRHVKHEGCRNAIV